jgi:hypothetical protein
MFPLAAQEPRQTKRRDRTMSTKPTTKSTAPECPLDDVEKHLRRFLVMPSDHHFTILSLWVAHTYAFDAAYATPYLYVNSAEKQSGKTRVIEVLSDLAQNPMVASSVSPSVIYRAIEGLNVTSDEDDAPTGKPTLFVDEVDAIFRGGAANEDLRNILNSGYKSNGSVLRTIPGKDGGEAKFFSTFAPKLLAGIDNGAIPDTIADRCIALNLKRKREDEKVERYLSRRVADDCEALRVKLDKWVRANMDHFMAAEPAVMEELSDRAFEIVEPLLAIAARGKGWTKRAQDAARHLLTAEAAPLSEGAKVLLAAWELFEGTGADKITTSSLSEATGLNGKALGIRLARYDVKPTTIRFPHTTAKGYYRRSFEDAWTRYLPTDARG